jgi:hypothetical protein
LIWRNIYGVDFADESVSQSISPKVSKYQFDTLDCSLEELAVVERIAQKKAVE